MSYRGYRDYSYDLGVECLTRAYRDYLGFRSFSVW